MKNQNKAKENPADYFRTPELGKKKVTANPERRKVSCWKQAIDFCLSDGKEQGVKVPEKKIPFIISS